METAKPTMVSLARTSERKVVVRVIALELVLGLSGGPLLTPGARVPRRGVPARATRRVEDDHLVGHDLRHVPFLARLVVPGPRLDAALDVHLASLLKVLL